MSVSIQNHSRVEVSNQSLARVKQNLASELLTVYDPKNIEGNTRTVLSEREFINQFLSKLEEYYDKQNKELSTEGGCKSLFVLFGFTCVAGILSALLDGIDGIASIVQLIPLPPILSALIIATFALISITVFVGFDISESAKSLGIQLDRNHETPLGQMAELKKKIQKANCYMEAAIIKADSDELVQLSIDLNKLIALNRQLDKEIKSVETFIASSFAVNFWRKFAATACTLLYLNFGFFTGQAGILYLLGNISFSAAMINPITASIVIGGGLLSAFGYAAFFYLVQCSSVENLITKHVYGIDIETLEVSQSEELTVELSTSLELKQKQIAKINDLKDTCQLLENKIKDQEEKLDQRNVFPGKFSIFAQKASAIDTGTSAGNDIDCENSPKLRYHFGC